MSFATDLHTRALKSSATATVVMERTPSPGHEAFANSAFEQLTGFRADDLSAGLEFLHGPDTDARSIARLRGAMAEGAEIRLVILSYRKDGGSFWNQLHVLPLRDESGMATHLMVLMTDITEEQILQQRLKHRAHHDALTGLPNRHLLQERLEEQLVRARVDKTAFAMAVIDVNGFKKINDTLGHQAGDQVLLIVAARLARCARFCDTVARFGGDEFVMLLRGDQSGEPFIEIGARIDNAMRSPVNLGACELRLSCSVGVVVYPTDGTDVGTLLRRADERMYAEKRGRRGAAAINCYEPGPWTFANATAAPKKSSDAGAARDCVPCP